MPTASSLLNQSWPFNILTHSFNKTVVLKRYVTFSIISILIFAAAYYTLMEQSIRYTNAINNDLQKLDKTKLYKHEKKDNDKFKFSPKAPAGMLYLGKEEEVYQSIEKHDLINALYFSLSVQSTLGPPHYPPNQAWKILTSIHIMFVIAGTALTIV